MSVDAIFQKMKPYLNKGFTDEAIYQKAKIVDEILTLKKEKNAVILGHNYMEPALFHFVPDFKGDSLELSRKAAKVEQDIIVFCGVRFMAETAKILSPQKQVLVPSAQAGCSLASSITAEDVRALKAKYPGVPVVTYINTYADVKAETDICCTSGNAVKVVDSLDSDTVIFIPDEYLAKNVAQETGKSIIFPQVINGNGLNKKADLIGWQGRCEVHEQFTVGDIDMVREKFPETVVLAHPECSPEVTAAADFSGSTSAMIKYVQQVDAPRFLLLTECAMGDNIAAEYPQKELLRICSLRCPHMAEITLEDTRDALKFNQFEVDVPEDIRVKALRAVERMLAIG